MVENGGKEEEREGEEEGGIKLDEDKGEGKEEKVKETGARLGRQEQTDGIRP